MTVVAVNPETTRRPGVAWIPVVLADGESWGLALPARRVLPAVSVVVDEFGRASEVIEPRVVSCQPIGVEELRDALELAVERGTLEEQYKAFVSLASCLLMAVHAIDLQTAESLMAVPASDVPMLIGTIVAISAPHSRSPSEKSREGLSP